MGCGRFTIEWQLRAPGQAQCPADPRYPDGMALDLSDGRGTTCTTDLPYPAAGLGVHLITCRLCGACVMVTAAGRRDDPRCITLPCHTLTNGMRPI